MTRFKTLSIAALLALGACTGDGDDAPQTVAQPLSNPADIQLNYCWNAEAHGTTESHCNGTNPSAAYQAGDAGRRQLCSNDQTCIDEGVVFVQPTVWLGSNPVGVLTSNGFDATFKRYEEGVRNVRSFFEAQGANVRATDYARSLGAMDSQLKMLRDFAQQPLGPRADALAAVNKVPERIADLGAAVRGEEAARLAKKRILLGRAQQVITDHQASLHALRDEYTAIAAEYRDFRGTEAATTATLRSIALRGSAAALPALPGLQEEVVTLLRAQNDAPLDVIVRVRRLSATLEARRDAFATAIAPYGEFLAGENIAVPDLTSEPIHVLTGMLGYLRDRLQRTNVQVSTLLSDLVRRKSALILAQRDQLIRKGVADATRARAAADFLTASTATVNAVWANQPQAAGVELLEDRWNGIVALLQTEQMCTGDDTSPWMASGCDTYRRNYSKARLYRDNTLARTIRRDATKLRTAGADAQSLAALETAVTAADFALATHLHDTIARGLGGTP